MKLNKILDSIEYESLNFEDYDVSGIEHDSRKIKPGNIYACLKGLSFDGHDFARSACDAGAVCLLVERFIDDLDCIQIKVSDARVSYAVMASNWYERPYKKLKVIAVTGTNGKTTTAHMIGRISNSIGMRTAVLGSLGTFINGKTYKQELNLNTPDPMDFHGRLKLAADEKCEFVVMETSAHGLYLKKTEPVKFAAGVFTNLTQDHLDDFGTMENYKDAKKLLFSDTRCEMAVVNVDDDEYGYMIEDFHGKTVLYGITGKADVKAVDVNCDLGGSSFEIEMDGHKYPLMLNLAGRFNVYNCLAAVAACVKLGADPEKVVEAAGKLINVDGRMEKVDCGQDFLVIVDYAHTPDSLKNVLSAARGFTQNKVISVFGCGGDRDAKKRPVMGTLSSELADYTIITSDNPRTEEPDSIIDMIETGMTTTEYKRITDRRLAIYESLSMAQTGDVVVIAGKGHETYQDVMGKKHHFDDREIVKEYFKEK